MVGGGGGGGGGDKKGRERRIVVEKGIHSGERGVLHGGVGGGTAQGVGGGGGFHAEENGVGIIFEEDLKVLPPRVYNTNAGTSVGTSVQLCLAPSRHVRTVRVSLICK